MSQKEILRSSSIIGGAALVNIAIGLVKTKVVALILGPAGLGIIILLQNAMQTAASVASLGLGQAGTRQVADAVGRDDAAGVALARRTLLVATTLLALAAATVIWLGGDRLAGWLALGPQMAARMPWLAIGTALIVAAQAQTALLMGFRRVGDLARAGTLSVVVAAAVGIAAVYWWGEDGIVAFVMSQVVATFAIGHLYVTRLERPAPVPIPPAAVRRELGALLLFGGALTVAAVSVNVGQLLARALIQQRLGAAAVGMFQASWLVSITYIGFVLQAMGADFYPRIVAAAQEPGRLARLVNEQTEVALLLAAPVLLGVLGTAPWVMLLLYSRAFDSAVPVLQWQVLGDVLKVASWPLGYLLLAVGASRVFMLLEIAAILVLLAVLWLLLPGLGLEAGGASVLAMYALYLPSAYAVAGRRVGFRWTRATMILLAALFSACALIMVTSRLLPVAGAALGIALSGAAGVVCVVRLQDALPGALGRAARRLGRAISVRGLASDQMPKL